MMENDELVNSLRNLHQDESGQGLVEYLLILALVAFAATAGMTTLASGLNSAFTADRPASYWAPISHSDRACFGIRTYPNAGYLNQNRPSLRLLDLCVRTIDSLVKRLWTNISYCAPWLSRVWERSWMFVAAGFPTG